MQGDRKELPSLMTAEPRSMFVGSAQDTRNMQFFQITGGFKLDGSEKAPATILHNFGPPLHFGPEFPVFNTRPAPGTMLCAHVELIGVWQVFIKFRMACENRFGCQQVFAATWHYPTILFCVNSIHHTNYASYLNLYIAETVYIYTYDYIIWELDKIYDTK